MLQLPVLAQVRGAQVLRMRGMLQLPVLAQVGRKGEGWRGGGVGERGREGCGEAAR